MLDQLLEFVVSLLKPIQPLLDFLVPEEDVRAPPMNELNQGYLIVGASRHPLVSCQQLDLVAVVDAANPDSSRW